MLVLPSVASVVAERSQIAKLVPCFHRLNEASRTQYIVAVQNFNTIEGIVRRSPTVWLNRSSKKHFKQKLL